MEDVRKEIQADVRRELKVEVDRLSSAYRSAVDAGSEPSQLVVILCELGRALGGIAALKIIEARKGSNPSSPDVSAFGVGDDTYGNVLRRDGLWVDPGDPTT